MRPRRPRVAQLKTVWRFFRDESGTSDVEYVLITALVVPPLLIVVPPLLMAANYVMFDRIHFWVNMPFP